MNKLRMSAWVLLAFVFYGAAMAITVPSSGGSLAQLQTGLWKAGHITFGAYLGYWIDRHLFGRCDFTSDGLRIIARAVVVAAAIAGMALGL